MVKLPPIELLEATHQFPGPYTFKVIGEQDASFEARVVAAVRELLDYPVDPPYEVRESNGGRHVAVTLELLMESSKQVHSVYERLSKLKGILVML